MKNAPEQAAPDDALTNAAGPAPLARKPIQTFALHVAFLTLLFWVLPSLDAVYAFAFKAAGNAAFGEIGENLRVEYSYVPPGARDTPGEIEIVGRVVGVERSAWESSFSVRDRGYQPTALLVALMLATPMRRRRRVLGTAAGLVVLNAFILGQTGLLAIAAFGAANASLVPMGEWLGGSVEVVKQFTRQPIPWYAAVFATWALFAAPARGLDAGPLRKVLRVWFGGPQPKSPS